MQLEEPPTWEQLHGYYSTFAGPQFKNKRTPGDVAPTDRAPIIALRNGERRMAEARWWLVPEWARDLKQTKHHMFNCRDDRLREAHEEFKRTRRVNGPFLKPFLQGRRCLIPVNGYYEYFQGKPVQFVMKDQPIFALAGIWNWNPNIKTPDWPGGVVSFTMVTTEPNRLAKMFHHRMPVILDPCDYNQWLSPNTPAYEALAMLRPYRGTGLKVKPFEPVDDGQADLFADERRG
ncbi:SOS response-associated peptidase [Kordiimonas gwangyangensis]|nr:SOS response-associated peptidase [Kordiimonas gwangyangensis]